jgi:transposase
MPCSLSLSSFVPAGLAVDRQEFSDGILIVTASARISSAPCPACDRLSQRVHSRYHRRVADLPLGGHAVQLRLVTRRFRCDGRTCRQKIFAERFGTTVPERARRTDRMEGIVHHLGLALGGRPGAVFAARLMLPVSNDTLLRVVRRRARPRTDALCVVGVDDWAFRRNHRYGTIVCDLERRQIVKLLPDREIATVAAWLSAHPGIRVVSRDRGGGYGEATARALPDAIQVADRWHLMENASAAFLEAVSKSMKAIRAALGATIVDPQLLTAAERLQYEGYLRREETNTLIAELTVNGVAIKDIVRRTGRSRKLVRLIVRGERTDVFRARQGSLDPHLPFLDAQWEAGCRNGAELWRRLRAKGFSGSARVVSEWTTRRRRSERMTTAQLRRPPSARTLAGLMTLKRDHLTKAETLTLAAIEKGAPALTEARTLIDRFQSIVRRKAVGELDTWLCDAWTQPDRLLRPRRHEGSCRRASCHRRAMVEWSDRRTRQPLEAGQTPDVRPRQAGSP